MDGRTYGRRRRRRTVSDHKSSPWAFSSGELKNINCTMKRYGETDFRFYIFFGFKDNVYLVSRTMYTNVLASLKLVSNARGSNKTSPRAYYNFFYYNFNFFIESLSPFSVFENRVQITPVLWDIRSTAFYTATILRVSMKLRLLFSCFTWSLFRDCICLTPHHQKARSWFIFLVIVWDTLYIL